MNLNDIPLFDSDEDDIDNIPVIRRPKTFKIRINFFDDIDEIDFINRFRLSKNTCRGILQQIEGIIKSETNRNSALTPATKFLLTLRFFATGSMLIVAADFVGVSKTSACESVKIVTVALCELNRRYIKFPQTPEEIDAQMVRFYNIARFPNVLGAIDCTHIRIQSPGGPNAEEFRNRKGYFSWNVQVVSDDKLRIQDIVVRWPGRTHDQTIFDNSRLKARFETGEMGNGLLLGDSGYGIKNYLITPLLHPETPAETLFNESQIRTRNVVERMFGVWKRRFPILSLGMRVSLERVQAIIVATAILHNLAINENNYNEFNEPLVEEVVHEQVQLENQVHLQVDNAKRRSLINAHFTNLL